jgi:hypothetical protein
MFVVCMSLEGCIVGETPTLASCGVSAVQYGSRTMVRNALTTSPTREHDR